MKIPKKIRSNMAIILDIEDYKRQLIDELYKWIEEQGIDTQDIEFADAIGVRIENSEFSSVSELINDLKKYKNGEEVGYG